MLGKVKIYIASKSYVHGSVHHKFLLVNVQRDATICSLYFILLQDHSTCTLHVSGAFHTHHQEYIKL